jgi:hypothetical protein
VRLHRFIIYIFLLFAPFVKAQIVSQFDWNSNPVLLSVVGPSATSAGASATSSPNGVGGTNGLNPGAPTANDINLTIPNTGNIFDMNSIDVSIDYRRNESTASMVRRGNFNFNMGNASTNFRVTYRVNNAGTPVVITSTAYPIPQDATFRNYRFTYDNCSGVGTMYVNNTVVWSTPSPTANLNLYWVGDGSVIIGQDMDGANNNVPNLDNFIWQNYTCAALPIELSAFTGQVEIDKNLLKWTTTSEKNNDYFTLEKSEDGEQWFTVSKIIGAGNSSFTKTYQAYDPTPKKVVNYYRLQQTDFDGTSKKFSIVVIDNTKTNQARILKVTDIFGRELPLDSDQLRILYYSDGSVIKKTGK